jgi:hypothetical protein
MPDTNHEQLLPDKETSLMARKKREYLPVYRTDLLPSNLTASKERVRELLRAWRKGAVLLGREQWRLFHETGRFDKNHDVDKTTFASVIGAANRVQMCRWQVVGQLQSWISNRANEFRDTVNRSSLSPDVKRMLHVVNLRGAWFSRGDVVMRNTGETIPPEVRKLARSIMRHVMSRHRRPDLSRISMRLDHRAAELAKPIKATQGGKVGWWINLATMEKGRKIAVPLLTYGHKLHADLNAAANIEARRARPNGWLFQGKAAVLAELVREFGERRVRALRLGRTGSPRRPTSDKSLLRWDAVGRGEVIRTPRDVREIAQDSSPCRCLS